MTRTELTKIAPGELTAEQNPTFDQIFDYITVPEIRGAAPDYEELYNMVALAVEQDNYSRTQNYPKLYTDAAKIALGMVTRVDNPQWDATGNMLVSLFTQLACNWQIHNSPKN